MENSQIVSRPGLGTLTGPERTIWKIQYKFWLETGHLDLQAEALADDKIKKTRAIRNHVARH
jgi:hypothetical protein